MPVVAHFIPPCQPTRADRPPRTPNWIHEIKHDGYRLMVRRDSSGIRLITRNGNDWTERFPLIVAAVAAKMLFRTRLSFTRGTPADCRAASA